MPSIFICVKMSERLFMDWHIFPRVWIWDLPSVALKHRLSYQTNNNRWAIQTIATRWGATTGHSVSFMSIVRHVLAMASSLTAYLTMGERDDLDRHIWNRSGLPFPILSHICLCFHVFIYGPIYKCRPDLRSIGSGAKRAADANPSGDRSRFIYTAGCFYDSTIQLKGK